MLTSMNFLLELFLTYCIEIPLMVLIILGVFHEKISVWRIIFVGICTSGLTLPYLWFVLPDYLGGILYLLIGEFLVFLVEAAIMNQFLPLNIKRALICSFIVNAASCIIGGFIL